MWKFLKRSLISSLVLSLTLSLVLFFTKPKDVTMRVHVQSLIVHHAGPVLAQMMKKKMNLPQPVNEVMKLEDISTDREKFIYDFSANVDAAQFNLLAADFKRTMEETGCQRPDYRYLLGHGFTVVLKLRTVTGTQAQPVVFTAKGCGL